MFLELKEIAHCLQWKKKVIEEKDEGERRDFHFAQGRCADVSHASLCALIPSNDSFLFHTNPSFRVFLTKTEMFNERSVKFRNELMFHATLCCNGDWHNRPIQIDYSSLKELASSFPSFPSKWLPTAIINAIFERKIKRWSRIKLQ